VEYYEAAIERLKASQQALCDSLGACQKRYPDSARVAHHVAVTNQRLAKLLEFCSRRPDLPVAHLWAVLFSSSAQAAALPVPPKPRHKGQAGESREAILKSVVRHLTAGGSIANMNEAAEVSGYTFRTPQRHFGHVAHLLLAAFELLFKDTSP
jgi:hypothetical protein